MTLIAAVIAADGAVWMGGDSAGSNDNNVWARTDSKVWTHSEMVLGFAGSFRARDILRYQMALTMPAAGDDLDNYMRTVFVPAMQESYRSNGFMARWQEGNDKSLAQLLVGLRGRVFGVGPDFSVGSWNTDYAAIGSGTREAQGSLFSTRNWTDPKARIFEALEAACLYVPSVSGPYHFVRSAPTTEQAVAA